MLQSAIFSILVREFYSLYATSLTIIFLSLISEIYSRLIHKIEDEEMEFTLLIRLSLLYKYLYIYILYIFYLYIYILYKFYNTLYKYFYINIFFITRVEDIIEQSW